MRCKAVVRDRKKGLKLLMLSIRRNMPEISEMMEKNLLALINIIEILGRFRSRFDNMLRSYISIPRMKREFS